MDLKYLVFDVLGTVVDERGSFRAACAQIAENVTDSNELADSWLASVDATTSAIAAGQIPWRPWNDVVRDGLARRAPALAKSTDGHELISAAVNRMRPWPDSVPGLRTLRSHFPVVALSNASASALVNTFRAADLTWDLVVVGDMAEAAKPNPAAYHFLLGILDVEPAHVLMVAAHPWDLRAAADLGMRTAYVPRPGEDQSTDGDSFDVTSSDFVELARVLTQS